MGWLTGWKQRRKITIDNTNIDSDLTHFPVPIVLGTSVGQSSQDVTDIFDELVYDDVDDDFTGTNGDPPNEDLWGDVLGTTSAECLINTNKLRISDSATATRLISSNFLLSGNFGIQVDYDIVTEPGNALYVPFKVSNSANTKYAFIGRNWDAQTYWKYNDGSGTSYTADPEDYITGKYRLVRSGSDISGYIWTGSTWSQIGTAETVTSEDMYISCEAQHAGAVAAYIVDFDNFVVNSGTIKWPVNTNPNRKKIALTKDDGASELYGEIELWDSTNEKAVIWVSKHDLVYSSSATTDLYLYFDSLQSDNPLVGNTQKWNETTAITGDTFTGDDDDLPNEDLWDSNGFTIQSNQVKFIHSIGDDDIINLTSRCRLTDDFSIEVDFERTQSAIGEFASFTLGLLDVESNKLFRVGNGMSSSSSYQILRNEYGDLDYDFNSFYYGAFKITRAGDQWSFYIKSADGSFVQYNTAYTGFTTDARIQLQASLPATHDDNAVAIFDNFVINSGTVLINPGHHVWDDGFHFVHHMKDNTTSEILDSTRNENTGTKDSADNPIEVNFGAGKGQDFSSDIIDFGSGDSLDITGNITIEAEFRLDALPGAGKYPLILGKRTTFKGYQLGFFSTNEIAFYTGNSTFTGWILSQESGVLSIDTDYYMAGIYDSSNLRLVVDVTEKTPLTAHTTGLPSAPTSVMTGAHVSDPATYGYIDGKEGELRISNTDRSLAWLKTTRYSLKDDLIIFAATELEPISGYDPQPIIIIFT